MCVCACVNGGRERADYSTVGICHCNRARCALGMLGACAECLGVGLAGVLRAARGTIEAHMWERDDGLCSKAADQARTVGRLSACCCCAAQPELAGAAGIRGVTW